MKLKKLKYILLLLLLLFLPLINANAETTADGSCGEYLVWELDEAGTLTINGTGKMNPFYYAYNAPWYPYRSDIESVVIENGVTTVSSYAFHYYETLTAVTLPESISVIGSDAFSNCSNLESITLPEGMITIEGATFFNCKELKDITIPAYLEKVGSYSFSRCSKLAEVHYPETETKWQEITIEKGNEPLINAYFIDVTGIGVKESALSFDDTGITATITFDFLKRDIDLFLAVYENNILKDITNTAIKAGESSATITLPVSSGYEGCHYKLFFWDKNLFIPLADTVEGSI